ncbi:unnamed protein product [Schistocephalus solidus]|uniref:Uncharacterized protein n=1 Tax=Schistocephalus solidus TaxID=70667 RepID=A0A183S8E0_SCHSO|nr:unnamed protein product [Schistocephalus solidus]
MPGLYSEHYNDHAQFRLEEKEQDASGIDGCYLETYWWSKAQACCKLWAFDSYAVLQFLVFFWLKLGTQTIRVEDDSVEKKQMQSQGKSFIRLTFRIPQRRYQIRRDSVVARRTFSVHFLRAIFPLTSVRGLIPENCDQPEVFARASKRVLDLARQCEIDPLSVLFSDAWDQKPLRETQLVLPIRAH